MTPFPLSMRFRSLVATSVGLVAATLLLAPRGLAAQGSLREQTRNQTRADGGPTQIIAINPFLPLAGRFQGEYERKIQQNASFALAGSYVPWDDNDYLNIDAKLRLYPQDRALEGLGFSAGLGVGRAKQDVIIDVCIPSPSCIPAVLPGAWVTAPTFSIETQYQWLMGRTRSTAVTIGGGAKRYFLSDQQAQGGLVRVVPTGRLTIGWAF